MKPVFRSPVLRSLLCVLMLLLISGCSIVRIGYGQLDTVAGWMAHDYFDLQPAQREQFDRGFERLHAWHRHEQLPEYARFLGETRLRAQRGLQARDFQDGVLRPGSGYGESDAQRHSPNDCCPVFRGS